MGYSREKCICFRWVNSRKNTSYPNSFKSADSRRKLIPFEFRNRWLQKLKTQNRIQCYRPHGESSDADLKVIGAAYALHDTRHADGFRLLYQMPAGDTLAPVPILELKNEKKLITWLPRCNAYGSEKMPIFIVGNKKMALFLRTKLYLRWVFDTRIALELV